MRTLLAAMLCAGCVTSSSTVCDFGLCPEGTACDVTHQLCVAPEQLTACGSLAAADACAAGAISGHCVDGVCLPTVCADGIVEPGEACDDGNLIGNDSCSADCASNVTCGNGIVDEVTGEQCDDGNHLDHDGCSSTCRREVPRWLAHTVVLPKRQVAAAAYDARRDRVVLFGGADPGTLGTDLGDTWEWTGGDWVRVATDGPPARESSAMAFDAAGHVVLFGGDSGSTFGDTWIWDGATWTNIDTPGPSSRKGVALAYDPHHRVTIAFGGFGPTPPIGNQKAFDDTYAWNGATWTKLMPAHKPPARQDALLAYDYVRGVLVMTGGRTSEAGAIANDTWTFDGTDWTNVTPAGSQPNVFSGAIGWDASSQRVVVFGGNTSFSTYTAAMWAWTGTAWTSVSAAGPTARGGVAFAATPSRLVVATGNTGTASGETWLFANNTWTAPKDFAQRTSFGLVEDTARGRLVFYGGSTVVAGAGLADTWDFDERDGFSVRANGSPAGRASPCMVYDPVRRETVLFGGLIGSTANAETWIWNGTAWSQKTPAMSPEARFDAACAYDGAHVTVYGGKSGPTTLATAWSWTGTTWTPVAVPPELGARFGSTAGYDPIAHHMVLFGGRNANELLADTWTYDGTSWHAVAAGFAPPARGDATLTWNFARGSLILAGGSGGASASLDAYEWHVDHWLSIAAADPPNARTLHGSAPSVDGNSIFVYGGQATTAAGMTFSDRYELRWDGAVAGERCNANDADGDGLRGCADDDCWYSCTPACAPGTSCDTGAARCGDGICDANVESCATCPTDCTCTPVCGDAICDTGESCPGDCP